MYRVQLLDVLIFRSIFFGVIDISACYSNSFENLLGNQQRILLSTMVHFSPLFFVRVLYRAYVYTECIRP